MCAGVCGGEHEIEEFDKGLKPVLSFLGGPGAADGVLEDATNVHATAEVDLPGGGKPREAKGRDDEGEKGQQGTMSACVTMDDYVFPFSYCLVEDAEHAEVLAVTVASVPNSPACPDGPCGEEEWLKDLIIVVDIGVGRAGIVC